MSWTLSTGERHHSIKLNEDHTYPPLKPIKVPVNSIPTFQCVACTTQLGVISKLNQAYSVQVSVSLTKIIYSSGLSTNSWGTPLVTGLYLDIGPLTATHQFLYPPSLPSFKTISLQFSDCLLHLIIINHNQIIVSLSLLKNSPVQ